MVSLIVISTLVTNTLCSIGSVEITDFLHRLKEHQHLLPTCLSRFVNYDEQSPKAKLERNPSFYLKDLDFTCVSPWNDRTGRFRAGTAISRRHIIFAKHHSLHIGSRLAFVGLYGDVTHYTMTKSMSVADTDIMIGLLDYDLTPDISPAKLLPPDVAQKIPDVTTWPGVVFDQHERAYVTAITCHWKNKSPYIALFTDHFSAPDTEGFRANLISGDSGNPAFIIHKGRPILIYCVKSGGAGAGEALHLFRWKIQNVMDELCPGYKLESAF